LQPNERHCVKVIGPSSVVRALVGAALVVAVAMTVSLSAPAQAHAITRKTIVKRGNVWVKKRISYSQSRYYKGYRRDCSGFVSMAWKLKKSYTTRTISKRAKRIKITSLKPGDAVLIPGHVSLFAGWKNKKKRTYYALEQTTWGSHAKKRVRTIPRGAKALRRKGITTPKRRTPVVSKPRPPAPSAPSTWSVDPPSIDTSLGALPYGSVYETPTAMPSTTGSATPELVPSVFSMLDSTVVGVRFVI